MTSKEPRKSLQRVGMRDIAREAGVSVMTVSRVMRNQKYVRPEIRARVQKVVRKWDYRLDPVLSAFSARCRPSKAYHGKLAWMHNWPTVDGWKKAVVSIEYFNGALERAKEIGYQLETFWLRSEGMTSQRMASIFRAQNIAGLLLPPQHRPHARLNFPWNDFSTVTFGSTLERPPLHRVMNHQFLSMRLLMRKLRALGYRRFGFAPGNVDLQRASGIIAGAFLLEESRLDPKHRIPILTEDLNQSYSRNRFLKWFERYKPEVVVAVHMPIMEWVKSTGRRIPEDVGFACYSVVGHAKNLAGVYQGNHEIGRASIDLVISLMQRGERGIPTVPLYHMIPGQWRMAKTVRRLN